MLNQTTIIADASGDCVKIVLSKNGSIANQISTDAPALETFASAMNKICDDFSNIENYAVCTGPGSMLGERFSSVYICTLAKLFNAKIFEWDSMKVAAFALSISKNIDTFTLVAPSRKGWVNVLKFSNGEIESELETEIATLSEIENVFLLKQRKNLPTQFELFEEFSPSAEMIFEALKRRPELLSECELPPDAKSLTKREYVKWKAQAHI